MHTTHARIYYVRYTYIRLKWYYYHGAVQVFQKRKTCTSHSTDVR